MQANTGNPAFRGTVFDDWAMADSRATTMTVQGTSIKTLILLAILSVTAGWSWTATARGDLTMPVVFGALIAGLVLAFVTVFWKNLAVYTAPLYAAAEGVFLGAISNIFEQGAYKGMAFQAVSLTLATLFLMLLIYSTGLIRVTDKLRVGIVAATGAVALVYLVSLVLGMFTTIQVPFIHSAGPIGIAFSVFVVGLAAFNLLLDFDFIDQASRHGAPKSLEWYGAFGLLVTLVWLYLEILRLLSKLQRR